MGWCCENREGFYTLYEGKANDWENGSNRPRRGKKYRRKCLIGNDNFCFSDSVN